MDGATRIGIMGGTFDPIHFGHLATAEEVKYRFGLQKVLFIPCGIPSHKKNYSVSEAEHRYAMTRLAVGDNPEFEVSRLEIDRQGISYSVDTLAELRRLKPEVQWYFITGWDAVMEILTWREPHRLAEMCTLVAATRPGYDFASFQERVGEELAAKIEVLSVPGVDISSTEIRCRVAKGAPIRYLVPEQVRIYIENAGLYR